MRNIRFLSIAFFSFLLITIASLFQLTNFPTISSQIQAASLPVVSTEIPKSFNHLQAQRYGNAGVSTEFNTDRYGSDYKHFDLPVDRPDLCQAACAKDSRCQAYTYIKPGYFGRPKPSCWLKEPAPPSTPAECCISGIKTNFSPQPQQPVTRQSQGSGMMNEMLNAHNQWRAKVGVPPLRWSNELANYAQDWANQLAAIGQLQHRQEHKYGENLFMIRGSQSSPTEVVNDWGSEVKDYDYNSNSCRRICGHYTQIVWKETMEVGCGVARSGNQEVWVCNYNPHGNRIGHQPY